MYIQSYEKKGSVSPPKAEPCEQGFSLGFSPISGDADSLQEASRSIVLLECKCKKKRDTSFVKMHDCSMLKHLLT